MKIDRNQLKNLIAEELRHSHTALLETLPPPPGESARPDEKIEAEDVYKAHDDEPDEHEGEMARRALYHMAQQSQQLHDMIVADDNLEPWVAEKISLAADYLEKAFKAITYDKGPGQGRL